MDMTFGLRPEKRAVLDNVTRMIAEDVIPLEDEYAAEVAKGDRWTYTDRQAAILEGLKAKAKAAGLWNFWLTDSEKGLRADHGRVRLSGRGDGQGAACRGGVQLLGPGHRQHGGLRALWQRRR